MTNLEEGTLEDTTRGNREESEGSDRERPKKEKPWKGRMESDIKASDAPGDGPEGHLDSCRVARAVRI